MNPYQKAAIVGIRTLAILLQFYFLFVLFSVGEFINGINPIFYLLVVPVVLYFLAKPIAWLATLGIK